MATEPLSYSLAIATYNRPDVLKVCLRLAALQTVRPCQIVVVDASESWEDSREACLEELRRCAFAGEVVYEKAAERSLTVQRNQALRRVLGDIVFLFDDDSLMFPDCAERVLETYTSSPEAVGVRASATSTPPVPLETLGEVKSAGAMAGSRAERLLRLPGAPWLWKNLMMQDAEQHFIPYQGWREWPAPTSQMARMGAVPERLFQGYLMTFRRSAIQGLAFEESFVAYAAGEDLDFTYRVGLRGPLFAATRARVYHHQAARGRLPRDIVITLSLLNTAFCVRKHSGENLGRNRRRFWTWMGRRLVSEALKDALSRRWALPQVRGLLRAARYAPGVFAAGPTEADVRHRQLQRDLLGWTAGH